MNFFFHSSELSKIDRLFGMSINNNESIAIGELKKSHHSDDEKTQTVDQLSANQLPVNQLSVDDHKLSETYDALHQNKLTMVYDMNKHDFYENVKMLYELNLNVKDIYMTRIILGKNRARMLNIDVSHIATPAYDATLDEIKNIHYDINVAISNYEFLKFVNSKDATLIKFNY